MSKLKNVPIFARDATGLVRSLGFLDQFIISQASFNLIGGSLSAILFTPYFFPGANLPMVIALGAIPAFALAFVYARFSAGMPRSGGDYVWSTRILGPLYGLVQMIMLVGANVIIGVGLSAWSVSAIAIPEVLYGWGLSTNTNVGTLVVAFGQPPLSFVVTAFVILLATGMAIVGLRQYVVIHKLVYIYYYLVVAMILGVMAVTNSSLIPSQFDHAMQFLGSSFTYSGVIQQASASGYTGSFSLTNTLWAAIPWGFFYYSGFNYGTYLSGETKNAGPTITRALLLSTAVALIVGVTMAQLAYNAFGSQFLNTASYIQSVSPLPVEPYVTFLESMSNPNLAMFFGIGLVVSWMFLCANWIITTARMLFAAAFDRLLPEKFADVSDHFHSPTWATIVTGIACIAYVALFVYGGVGATWLNTSLVVPVGYLLPLIATAAFGFIKPDLFKRTVGTVTKRSSVVIASIIGIICFAFYIMAETVPIYSGMFLGTSMIYAFGTVFAMAIIAAILYGLAKVRLNNIGIDIRKISEELPPE